MADFEGAVEMNAVTTVVGVLRKARDLVSSGQQLDIITAISSLKEEASAPTRDLAYYALLETLMGKGEASLSALGNPDHQDATVALFDATIRRMTSTLH